MCLLSPFLWTACVTPFNCKGKIDYCSLRRLLIMQARAGNGVVLLGSTGESLSLTDSERCMIVKFACDLKLNTKIMVCVPGVNLYQTFKLLNFCNDMPIHHYLITTPIYTKPGIIGQTLWFEKLLEKVHVPAMLYNVPSRAGVNLYPETVFNLYGHEKFWAIKDSSGTIASLIEYKEVAPNLKIFCGDDNIAFDMVVRGAVGLVSVASNILPSIARKYVKRCIFLSQRMMIKFEKKTIIQIMKDDDIKSLMGIWQRVCKLLLIASNPVPVKMFLHNIGIIEYNTVRLPLSMRDMLL
ncbi:MAG: 4-hydroxy-tetrahydrodipicolinate synthase [Wolbachia endosymbiont of Menacanthus eurysternus]|nr:MAG: 4-hydroxy-tetrahydrodipicolinate synthase [Wolbachia endosymbiont of Menacanthus eurysternus]